MKLVPISQNIDKTQKLFQSQDSQNLIQAYEEFYPKMGYQPPWIGYFIVDNELVKGSCSFVGAPKNNEVEIAYWTFPDFEGQGIASWACREIIQLAKKHQSDIIITAKTAPEENASTKILRNNGFSYVEEVNDDEIGEAWLWRLI